MEYVRETFYCDEDPFWSERDYLEVEYDSPEHVWLTAVSIETDDVVALKLKWEQANKLGCLLSAFAATKGKGEEK